MKILYTVLAFFITNYYFDASQSIINDNEDKNETSQQIRKTDEDPTFTKATNNFEKNKTLIQNFLSSLKEAELHFFWTTGYTISDNLRRVV